MAFPTQLCTVVKNISGVSRFFAYLGAHGVTLANNGTYSELGNLGSKFSGQRPSYDARMAAALASDLQGAKLQIIQTPRSIDPAASGTPKAAVINASDQFAVETLDYSS